MKRRLLKWLLRLFFVAVVLVVVLLLCRNAILRMVIEHNIHAQTGLNVEIGHFELGLATPSIEIQDLKIYNPPAFSNTTFVNIAEIHAEFDRDALLKREFHVTLLRFNLNELNIVKSPDGTTNIFELAKVAPTKSSTGISTPSFKEQTGYDFTDIDSLSVTFNKAKYIDLQNPANNREQTIGMTNCLVPNVKSISDLAGVILLIDLRSNHFFDPLIGKPQKPGALQDIFNIL
jgi:uncharacterized protein involved in outer membrane biogenesis